MAKRRVTKKSTRTTKASSTTASTSKLQANKGNKKIEEKEHEQEVLEQETATKRRTTRRAAKRNTRSEQDESASEGEPSGQESEEERDRLPSKRSRKKTEKKKRNTRSSPSRDDTAAAMESSMNQLSSLLTMSQTQDLGGAFIQQIPEEELREVLSASYLRKTKNNTQLIERFKRVSEVLRKLGQPDKIPEDLPWQHDFPSALIERKLSINRKDPDIQIFAANSIADVLRINAPESPYTDQELKTIFNFLLQQLEGLKHGSTDRLFAQRFYLLERLATIKIFVLVLSLPDPVDFVERLFETLFDIVSEKETYQQRAVSYIIDIMSSLLESCDEITTHMVELLLEQLLYRTDKQDEQLVTYNVARTVLERTVDCMSQPIGDYINSEWENLQKQKGTNVFKKRRARLFRMIYELTLISTRLLLHVIPNIFTQLKDEDMGTRSSVIQLLGSMFSAKESTFAKDYPSLFEEYLGRFDDAEYKIRVYMCSFASRMLINHHSAHNLINFKLEQRIMDNDEKVRRGVVEAVCEIATHFPHLISESLLKQIGERTRDKKAQLRMHTIHLLADLYQHHTEGIHKGNDFWNEEFLAKFAWIPGKIISYYVEPQVDSDERLFVEKQIDEYLLHKEVRPRTIALLDIWSRMNNFERTSFERILLVKRKFQSTVSSLLDYHESIHEDNVESDVDFSAEKRNSKHGEAEHVGRPFAKLNQIINTLSNMLPDQLTGKRVWRHVYKKKNNTRSELIKILKDCINTELTFEKSCKLKERAEALEKGETREIATYMTMVVQKCAMNLFTRDQVKIMFEHVDSALDKDIDSAMSTLLLLEMVSLIIPEIFVTSFSHIPTLIDNDDTGLLDTGITILNAAGRDMEEKDEATAKELHDRLFQLAYSGTVGQAKNAIRCISKMYIDRESELSDLLNVLVQKLKHNDELPAVLASMRIIALVAPEIYKLKIEKVTNFCLNKVLSRESKIASPRFGIPSIDCQSKVQAIKLLAASLVSKAKDGISESFNTLSTRVTSLLFSILMFKGDITKVTERKMADDDDEGIERYHEEMEDTVERSFTADHAQYRLAASKSIMELLSFREATPIISMDLPQFQMLCYVICDPVAEVRASFAKKLKDMLLSFKLALKYAAALILGVADPDPNNSATTRQYITLVVRFFREQHSRKKSIQLSDYAAVQLYPEYILPYLIHLLAHHPRFQAEYESDKMISFQRIFFAFFDEVCKEADNMTFFHQMIYKLKQRKDRQDMQSTRIQSLCDLAISVLGCVTEGRGSVHSFPGKIYIPGMFVSTATPGEDGEESTQQQHERIDTIKTLFLPPDFHLDEKKARDFRTHLADPASPKRKTQKNNEVTAPDSPSKRRAKNKKRKRAAAVKRNESEESVVAKSKRRRKASNETITTETAELAPRKQPSRSARKNTKYVEEEIEENEESEEEEEEEEEEEVVENEESGEEDDISDNEEEIKEQRHEIQPTRRRRKRY